ncbi:hypothetical protein [Streptomyces boninensis]|uniref:hypothetical protein n=1 Tax=Streptomyces boninensis TaxID=2039455 RepID=UPI003B20F239
MDALSLTARAETEKIARLLGTEPQQLAFLQPLPDADLRAFREQTAAALFDSAPDMLDRIAKATKLVPAAVAAVISQKALGPRLSAAVAGRLEPARAGDIISKLPVSFTAASCGYLDPRRIRGIVDRLEEDLVVRVAVALAENGDYLTMGRFVGHLRPTALKRAIELIDDISILRTGYVIDHPERIDDILQLLSAERLASVIRTAADQDRWPEALAVATMAGEGWRKEIARLPVLREGAVLRGAVTAVVAAGLWAPFLPLVTEIPEDGRKVVADAAGELPDDELEAMAREVEKQDLWDPVMELVELMEDGPKERIFALPFFQQGD